MLSEIIRELTIINKTNEMTSKKVLSWARTVIQMSEKALIEARKENEEFDTMKRHEEKNNTLDKAKASRRQIHTNCTYCRNANEPWKCPAYGKSC